MKLPEGSLRFGWGNKLNSRALTGSTVILMGFPLLSVKLPARSASVGTLVTRLFPASRRKPS